MEEKKIKESIDTFIGKEKLFTHQLRNRVLENALKTKPRGVPLFNKLKPILALLLIIVGSTTYFYLSSDFNVNNKSADTKKDQLVEKPIVEPVSEPIDPSQLGELTKSLEMVRWSSIARLDEYNNSFHDLEEFYKIHSNHVIEDDWYVINDEYFQIELLNYENAKKVDFYTLRLESDEGISLVFTDTESTDGWIYTNDTISKIINKHKGLSRNSTFAPYFVIYTEVTLENGNVIRTSKLPIYYK